MSLTKDEVSDLKSHVELLAQRSVELERAKNAHDDARRKLESFLHYQQYPEQKMHLKA
jgi:hypothetical protein